MAENVTEQLQKTIAELEIKQELQGRELKAQFNIVVDSLKPVNLVKSLLQDITDTPQIKEGLINTGIGMASGILSRKILVGKTYNPLKLVLGSILQYGVANIVARHGDDIRSAGSSLLQRLFRKKHQEADSSETDTEPQKQPYH